MSMPNPPQDFLCLNNARVAIFPICDSRFQIVTQIEKTRGLL
jgi:hypothetical protein